MDRPTGRAWESRNGDTRSLKLEQFVFRMPFPSLGCRPVPSCVRCVSWTPSCKCGQPIWIPMYLSQGPWRFTSHGRPPFYGYFSSGQLLEECSGIPPLNGCQFMVDSLGILIIFNLFNKFKLLQHLFTFFLSWVLHYEIYLACDSFAGIIEEGTKERWKMNQGLQVERSR